MNNPSDFSRFFRSYVNGTASAEERQAFFVLVEQEAMQEELERLVEEEIQNGKLTYQLDEIEKQEILSNIYQISTSQERKTKIGSVHTIWKKLTVAASILAVLGIGTYFYTKQAEKKQQLAYLNAMQPGKNTATLTLADGRQISLDSVANGQLAEQAGVYITKTEKGEIIYRADGKRAKGLSNTLSTAKGQQFRLVLPDGTNVWLNAASSIKYPTTFANLNLRQVELTGEAYFEVKKDKSHPFVVKTSGQEVEVLGTHFNINSYIEEGMVKTTLLEGLVQVTLSANTKKNVTKQTLLLKPDHQAVLDESGLRSIAVDVEAAVDWKNGKFIFENESLYAIMNKVSRWYNVDVQYQNEGLKAVTFTGTLSRYDHVNKVLSKLELTDEVEFKISDRKIIVTPK